MRMENKAKQEIRQLGGKEKMSNRKEMQSRS